MYICVQVSQYFVSLSRDVSLTLLEFGHQIHVEIVVAGGRRSFLLLAEDAGDMIVQSQSVGHGEVTHRTLVVLRHVDGLARVLT